MFGSENLDLIGYGTSLERDLAYKHIFMWGMRRACALGCMEKAKVLDIGCGFGWQALAVSMIGDNQITALDILPSMRREGLRCVTQSQEEIRVQHCPEAGRHLQS
jgi:ubiquinone/menaquinone biosynthesis C-methylase UbiE